MKSAFLLAAALLSTPAAAVGVTGIDLQGDNSATVIAAEPGLLAVDVGFSEFSPIRLRLAPDEGEDGFAFNSVVDSFTGVTLGRNMTTLYVKLRGAQFETVGGIQPAFSTAEWELNDDATLLAIRFKPDGEGLGLVLGNALDDGSDDFAILYTRGPVSLSFNSAVPEPASWALMIAGFGLVGSALRRRQVRHV